MNICITGGAGLVGQNLVLQMHELGFTNITVLDKHSHNLNILRSLNPQLTAIEVDIAEPGDWQAVVAEADVLVTLHAQIGGLQEQDFHRNNVLASRNVCAALQANPNCYLLHVSSSVLDSQADDFYTRSKREQEQVFAELVNPQCVLRPTLMFGWFDRKHLGWLSRFLKISPVFPVPGNGQYLRQPLYVGDFCRVIISSVQQRIRGETYSISGKEKITYIDIIRQIKQVTGQSTWVVNIPYGLFYLLLKVYSLFDRNPPFTVTQLQALVIDELFDDIDWEQEFDVQATPFAVAAQETFAHAKYSDITLEF